MKLSTLIITSILCGLVIFISLIAMVKIHPIKRPFLCNDISLSFKKKPSTIRNSVLYLWTFFVPPIIIFICEIFYNRRKLESMGERLAISWRNLSFFYGMYFINLSILHIFMTIVKLSTGSHRPHFFETCQPDALLNCTANSYVYDFKCTNTNIKGFYLRDSFMSFFSGHALLLSYSCCFTILYLQYRLRSKKCTLFWLPFMQSLLISFAFFGSISRVFDHHHHVVDISVGAIVGILMALHIWFTQCKNFKFNDVENNDEKYDIHDGNAEFLPVNSSSSSS